MLVRADQSLGGAGYQAREVTRPGDGRRQWVIFTDDGLHMEATQWLEFLRDSGRSWNTARTYARRVARYLSWLEGQGLGWREVSLSTLAAFKWTLSTDGYATGRSVEQRDPKTVEAWLTAVTQFYRWAAASGHVERDRVGAFFANRWVPAGKFGAEMGRTVEVKASVLGSSGRSKSKRPAWLEERAHRDGLRSMSLNTRDRLLVDLLDTTAMRIGEALSLRREDLHLTQNSTPVGCSITGPHVHVVRRADAPHGVYAKDRTGRHVPVGAHVAHHHWDYVEQRTARLGVDANPYVFVNLYGPASTRGSVMTMHSVNDLFARIGRHLGCRVTPHMLRHTRATIWVRGIDGPPVDLDVVQELLGHVSILSTRVYLHAGDEALRAAVENGAIAGRPATASEPGPA